MSGQPSSADESLRQAIRAREVLLASIAHDLRNPLNTFAMSSGLLKDDLEAPELDRARALSLLARMDRAAARMQGLIDDLLLASKVDAGDVELRRAPCEASTLVTAAIAAAKAAVGEKGATLEADAVVTASVNVDRARTVEAFVKLALLLLKHTGEGGALRIGAELDGGDVVFALRASLPRSGPVAPDEKRGGLALLIARGLVAAQGGQVAVDGQRLVARFPASGP